MSEAADGWFFRNVLWMLAYVLERILHFFAYVLERFLRFLAYVLENNCIFASRK